MEWDIFLRECEVARSVRSGDATADSTDISACLYVSCCDLARPAGSRHDLPLVSASLATFHDRDVLSASIVVQDRADATIPGEQRIGAVAEEVEVERLVGLLLAVPVDGDRDRLRRLAGGEGQRAGLTHVVGVA